MIVFQNVTITYPDSARAVLNNVSFHVPEGELCLAIGRTGSGKSTLLRAINGLVPHFTGGTVAGQVLVDGRDTRTHRPRDLCDVVGMVAQDPAASFVADVVEDEIAYGMEWLGLAPSVMRRRVEETLDLLSLADLRDRSLSSLSGGQRQRVAIGAALAAHPRILVLDEPTSALDPQAAEDVLSTLQRLVHDLGLTVLLAEHRLERVIQYAERVLHLTGDGRVESGTAREVMADSPVAPPVVHLGRLAGWQPLPLTVRDARREAAPLRRQFGQDAPVAALHAPVGSPLLSVEGLHLRYGHSVALRAVSAQVRAHEVVAVMGRNGAGKSSLLNAIVGLVRPTSGKVLVNDLDPKIEPAHRIAAVAGLVPQQPGDLLYGASVERECVQADRDAHAVPGTTRALLDRLTPGIAAASHPRDLSEGQRLSLALAVVLAAGPRVLLLDEPTRGLDYPAKARLVGVLRELADDGHAIVLATHDVELVAEVATRVLIIADGELVADGPTNEVVLGSPQFAPQVSKVFAPLPWLTLTDVEAALGTAS